MGKGEFVMIKILKEEKKRLVEICIYCDCEFEYEAEDVSRNREIIDNNGLTSVLTYYTIQCPCCDSKLTLNRKWTNADITKMK